MEIFLEGNVDMFMYTKVRKQPNACFSVGLCAVKELEQGDGVERCGGATSLEDECPA